MKITDYMIISGSDIKEFEKRVKTVLDAGWELQGGVVVVVGHGYNAELRCPVDVHTYSQAVIMLDRK